MPTMIVLVATTGLSSGSTTRKNNVSGPQPSIAAASSSSRGMVLMKLVMIKLPHGIFSAIRTVISPSCVFWICSILSSRTVGTIAYGTIRPSE